MIESKARLLGIIPPNSATSIIRLYLSTKLTLHISTLTNSTCYTPEDVVLVDLGIPTSSRTSANLAPPQMA